MTTKRIMFRDLYLIETVIKSLKLYSVSMTGLFNRVK